jgi:hypothetical protein
MTGERLSLQDAIEKYAQQTGLNTKKIDPATLEISFPNGSTGSIPEDFDSVLEVNGVDYEGANNTLEYSMPPETAFGMGVVVGAALQRDGLVPAHFRQAVDAIGSPEHINGEEDS